MVMAALVELVVPVTQLLPVMVAVHITRVLVVVQVVTAVMAVTAALVEPVALQVTEELPDRVVSKVSIAHLSMSAHVQAQLTV